MSPIKRSIGIRHLALISTLPLTIARNGSVAPNFLFNQAYINRKPSIRPSSFLAMTGSQTTINTPTSTSLENYSDAYKSLIKQLNTISQLERTAAVLSYDEMVFMPQSDETSKERGLQKSALAAIIHEKSTDPQIGEWITQSESDYSNAANDLSSNDLDSKMVLKLTKKSYEKKARTSAELVAKKVELESRAYSTWVKARTENNFSLFQPVLEESFEVAMEVAKVQRDSEDIPLYDEMLDTYEVGMASSRIDDLFSEVREALVPLIQKVLQSEKKLSSDDLYKTVKDFPLNQQKDFNEQIVCALGFDTNHGRLDVSVHPFTTSFSPMDVRITSRFRTDEWHQGLAGSIHECGHAMYEQNLGNSGLKVDNALSMGMHESQSLFWERHIGLSKSFWKYACPIVNQNLNTEYTEEELYEAINAVSQSFIRVEADELTYGLHVILRYGIERDIIEGKLKVEDIPKRWNDDMKSFLNVDVPNDAKGCLQDVHWSALLYGYFPTYLLGSMTAAQIAHYCKVEFPDMESMIEKGDFKPIKEWLSKKIHIHGSRYGSLDEHLEDQFGEKLNSKYFIQYLTNKYTDLYEY